MFDFDFDLGLAIQWLIFIKKDYKIYRLLIGGLWILFEDGKWVKCEWDEGFKDSHVTHPQDGGMFSVKLKLITTIENYSHGHKK